MRFTDAASLIQYQNQLCQSQSTEQKILWICGGTGCRASGSLKVLARGSPGRPSIEATRAVDSPQTNAPPPL
jgi:hypothetical protein